MTDTLYTIKGCTCYIDGKRGTVVLNDYSGAGRTEVGAFVRLDEGDMLYVELGQRVSACDCGSSKDHHVQCSVTSGRLNHSEVLGHRVIDRDEFDNLTGLAQARRAMGWAA